MHKILILVIALVFAGVACNKNNLAYMDGTIEIANKKINIDLAQTPDERQMGLSFRADLKEDQGMLFVFENPSRYGFWMKDMNFPIDIIWIEGDTVVDITSNLSPQQGIADKELISYYPKQNVDKVLEVQGGWSEKYGLKIGDKVKISLP